MVQVVYSSKVWTKEVGPNGSIRLIRWNKTKKIYDDIAEMSIKTFDQLKKDGSIRKCRGEVLVTE